MAVNPSARIVLSIEKDFEMSIYTSPEETSIKLHKPTVHAVARSTWPRGLASLLGLLLIFTANSMVLAGQLSVENGSGSGTFQTGETAYIYANPSDVLADGDANAEPTMPFPVLRIFDRWVGQTAFLDDPLSPRTTVTMPASNVSVSAAYRNASPWTIPSVLSYVPPDHIGLIFLFHGKDGCATCLANGAIMKPFIIDAIGRGYGVVIPEKLRREEPTWDTELDPELNLDMARISAIRRDMIDR